MPGKVIGEKLNYGYAGTPSRMPDCIIVPYKFDIAHAGSKINFGEPVAFDATNGGVRPLTSSDTATAVIGFAVRRISQPKSDDANGWYYAPGEVVDVLVRGSMSVKLVDTESLAARGQVYVTNGKYASRAAGGVMAKNDSTNGDTLAVPGAIFSHGQVDGDNVTEITLTQRIV